MTLVCRYVGRHARCASRRIQTGSFGSATELAAVIAKMQQVLKDNPKAGAASFAASSVQQDRLRSEVSMRQHKMTLDEPSDLGRNEGPSPTEAALMALGTCQEITTKAFSAAMGLQLDSVSVTVKGDIDWRGAYGIEGAQRPGPTKVGTQVLVSSPAEESSLHQLSQAVEAHCPVLDMYSKGVKVSVNMTSEPCENLGLGDDLAVAVTQRRNVLAANGENAQGSLTSLSMLTSGLRTVARAGVHEQVVDEPAELGGTDTGPNPVELLLAALCSSLEMTFKKRAAAAGVQVDKIATKAKGDMDVRGFFAVADYDTARPGFHTITVDMHVTSSAPADAVAALHAEVLRYDPVLDLLSNAVPLESGKLQITVA